MAAVLSYVLEKPVRYIQVPIDNMAHVGLPEGFALAFSRLLTKNALETYAIEPRTPDTTTSTTLREWARSTLLPAFKAFEKRVAD